MDPKIMLTLSSSDCLDEAKRRVYTDPSSNRSWNFCWLVLVKIQSECVKTHCLQFCCSRCSLSDSQLIPYYAHYQASMPAMWGNQTPTTDGIQRLRDAFIAEWKNAVDQMLRHWERPPIRG